jgi:low temperature requirement protein LtrA
MDERIEPAGASPGADEGRRATERRASFLELFFDLVFVFAITQVTNLIIGDTSPGGFARALVVFGIVWWAWSGFAWLTNAIDLDATLGRVAILAAAAGSFFVALAVPESYGDDGIWFAVPYLVVRLLHMAVYVYGLRDDREYQIAVARSAPFWLVSPFVIVVGALLDDELRVWVWAAAIAIDIGGALVAGRQAYRVSAAHFAERYQLFMIIALGESIVAVGVGIEAVERDVTYAAAAGVAFAGAALLWWAYFDFVSFVGERALHRADDALRGKLARDVYTFLHFPMVAGIILGAVAAKKTVEHPSDPLSTAGRFALAAGIALYMLGFVGIRWRMIRRLAWERLCAAITVPLVVLALRGIDALALLTVALAVLAGWIVAEAIRLREFRRRLHAD